MCCPCPSQDGCNCGSGSCALSCQKKNADGGADLCGFSEYGTPSSPPRKYRIQSFNEDFTFCSFGPGDCTGISATSRNVISGARTAYSKTTCAPTTTESRDVYGSGAGDCPLATTYAFTDSTGYSGEDMSSPPSVIGGMGLASETQTDLVYIPTGDCYISGGGKGLAISGDQHWDLSDEDTDQDAIDRANAPLGWTASNCLTEPAFITPRTTGFSFAYRSVQSRVYGSNLTPGHIYEATIYFYRRLLGSTGPWIFFSIAEVPCDPVGSDTFAYTDWVDVPNEDDFETRAQGCTIKDVTGP